jgi:dolichol-phosphate mannosyltransferase
MSGADPVVSFIVPALNEEQNLPPLFQRLLELTSKLDQPVEILLVDDASTDGTLRVAEEWSRGHPEIRVHHKPLPHGLGRGIRAGIEHARGRMGVIVMADGVDPLESAVPEFCQKVLVDQCHLVLLCRYRRTEDASSIPISYRVCHFAFRFLTSRMLGLPFADTTYAFRAFDLNYVRQLGLRSVGFEISPELTLKTYFHGGRIGEVSGSQTSRVHGKSNFRFMAVAPAYARVLLEGFRLRYRRWSGKGPVNL